MDLFNRDFLKKFRPGRLIESLGMYRDAGTGPGGGAIFGRSGDTLETISMIHYSNQGEQILPIIY